jgi:general secretion pathway protein D
MARIPQADAGTLIGLRTDITSAQITRMVLLFTNGIPTANGVPSYRIVGNDTPDVSLLLPGTVRASGPLPQSLGAGLVKAVAMEPAGDSLKVTFHEAVPANITVAPGAGQTLIVTIAASTPAVSVNTTPVVRRAVNGPLLPANDATEVVRLKYADVSEVVGLLAAGQPIPSNDSFTPQVQQFGSSGLTASGLPGGTLGAIGVQSSQVPVGAPAFGQTAMALGQQITENIGIDRRLNAIVLNGPPALIARYKAKIALIDVPLSSVELEVQIVELDDSAARDIGIDFTNAGGPVASASLAIKSLNNGQATANLQAAVYAQIQKGLGRSIARPRITALDGTMAQIITGTQIPIVTSIAVSGVSAVSSQVQYINVGVSLQIQPRITPDGFVTSHIFSQVSSQTGTVQNYPELSQREATTTATVQDGESFVIGGLLQQNEINSLAKVPGVGDLPIIGGLFRVRHDSTQNTNLYIIVTPHILKNGANPPPPSTHQ